MCVCERMIVDLRVPLLTNSHTHTIDNIDM